MTEFLSETMVGCPYCGERIAILVDHQDLDQQYIEDCQVCCRPITFSVALDARGGLLVSVRDENEV